MQDVKQQLGAAAHGKARPLSEWNEDVGPVLWWKFPLEEAPYVGTPLDLGQTVEISVTAYNVDKLMRANVGGWPGYHTHWTPLLAPAEPINTETPPQACSFGEAG